MSFLAIDFDEKLERGSEGSGSSMVRRGARGGWRVEDFGDVLIFDFDLRTKVSYLKDRFLPSNSPGYRVNVLTQAASI